MIFCLASGFYCVYTKKSIHVFITDLGSLPLEQSYIIIHTGSIMLPVLAVLQLHYGFHFCMTCNSFVKPWYQLGWPWKEKNQKQASCKFTSSYCLIIVTKWCKLEVVRCTLLPWWRQNMFWVMHAINCWWQFCGGFLCDVIVN